VKISAEQLNKHLGLIVIVVAGLVFLAIGLLFAGRVDAARSEFKASQAELKTRQSEIWRLAKIELGQLEISLAQSKLRFLGAERQTIFIKEVTELAKSYDVSIVSISPGNRVEAGGEDELSAIFDRVPLEMKLEGLYGDVGAFLSGLSELEYGIVRIKRVEMVKHASKEQQVSCNVSADLLAKKVSIKNILQESIARDAPVERSAGLSRFNGVERNPFTLVVKAGASELALEGIIYDPKAPLVLIGGEVKRVGDRVGDSEVAEILPDSVLFYQGSSKRELRVRLER
jgi:Tfp pilus assembly protein PilO